MSTSPIKPGTARRLGLDLPESPPPPRYRIAAMPLFSGEAGDTVARIVETMTEAVRKAHRARVQAVESAIVAGLPVGTRVERLPLGDDPRWFVGVVDMIDPLRPHGDTHRLALEGATSTGWFNPANLRRVPPAPGTILHTTHDEAERYTRTGALDPFPPEQPGVERHETPDSES